MESSSFWERYNTSYWDRWWSFTFIDTFLELLGPGKVGSCIYARLRFFIDADIGSSWPLIISDDNNDRKKEGQKMEGIRQRKLDLKK